MISKRFDIVLRVFDHIIQINPSFTQWNFILRMLTNSPSIHFYTPRDNNRVDVTSDPFIAEIYRISNNTSERAWMGWDVNFK
jgi:hypothetical protein